MSTRTRTTTPAITTHAFLADLNPEQRAAVTHEGGPLLIVAGAGTGKTTVITRRIAWLLLERGIPTDGVLALTFTEKAATEMEERVDRLLPYGSVDLWISTFHAFCQRILERHAIDIGLPNEFRLLDTTAAWLLLREHLDELPLDYYRPRGNPTKFLHALLEHFSRCKDEAVTPEDYLRYAQALRLNADAEGQSAPGGTQIAGEAAEANRIAEVANAYHAYDQLLRREGALDFGDLLLETLRLFRERPAILARYRRQFSHVLVDEFQDTNHAQVELVKLLAAPHGNLTVVGDDDQSIYQWRGAAMSNILHFREDYPETTSIAITTNYRATQDILDAAYRCIQENNPARLEVTLQLPKRLVAATPGEGTIEVLHARDATEEARMVVERILAVRGRGTPWNDVAILVRANRQAEQFLPALQAAGIPFLFGASRGLYRKPIILDLLAYLDLLDDHHESPACYRVLSMPVFGFTVDELLALTNWASRKAQSLYAVLRNARAVPGVHVETVAKADRVLALLGKHAELARNGSVRDVILAFLEDSGYLASLTREEDAADHEAVGFLNQFWKRVEAFEASTSSPTLRPFTAMLDLEREAGEEGALPIDLDAGPEAVRILTVHAAKGLEFPYVFLVNLVEQRFPSTDRAEPIELPIALTKVILPEGDLHLQEERRLFYVACTRAKAGLSLSYADDYGGTRKRKPSRFIAELGVTETRHTTSEHRSLPTPRDRTQSVDRSHSLQMPDSRSRIPVHALPSKLSFTQLRAYETCPWQYHYAHVLRIPLRGRWTLSFGQTMHLTLQRFFERVRERGSVEQSSLFSSRGEGERDGANVVPPLEELLQLYDGCWIDDWYQSAAQREQYRENGKRMLREFYAKHSGQWPRVQATEQSFIVKFGAHRVTGKIDRIDALPDGGVEIIDYKTGQPKDALTADDKLQLLIYQVAATQVLGQDPTLLSYYYLETNEKRSFLGSPEELTKLETTVAGIGERIANGDFAPNPGRHCRTCDFRTICPYAQG